MKVAHFEFIGEEVNGEESTFNLNIQVSKWVGGKSFKSEKKQKQKKKSREKKLGEGGGEKIKL